MSEFPSVKAITPREFELLVKGWLEAGAEGPLMARSKSPTLGHPKFPQAGPPDYDDSGATAMRAAASLRR